MIYRLRHHHLLSQSLLITLCMTIYACTSSIADHAIDTSATEHAISITGADQDSINSASSSVQWLFQPTVAERELLLPTLRAIRDEVYLSGEPVVGELHRFTTDSTTQRYLLIAIVPQHEKQEFVLYALEAGIEPAMKAVPYALGIEDLASNFADIDIADYDGDGAVDLVYCHWTDGQNVAGAAVAMGYRNGRWYRIERSTVPLPRCPESAS